MTTSVCTDLHIGYKEEDEDKLDVVTDLVSFCENNQIGRLVMTESYEMIWRKGEWWNNDGCAIRTKDIIGRLADKIEVYEITSNHFLDWRDFRRSFPSEFQNIRFVDELSICGWHIEHGHRLDPMFYVEKPWYRAVRCFKPSTPAEAKMQGNDERYKAIIEKIRMNYKCLAAAPGGPKHIIIGHTHSQEDVSNLVTGVRLINLGTLDADRVFLTIGDYGEVSFHRI